MVPKLLDNIVLLFVVVLPFTYIFSPTQLAQIPLLYMVGVMVLMLLKDWVHFSINIKSEDAVFFALVIYGAVLPLIVLPYNISEKNINYVFALLVSYGLYYLLFMRIAGNVSLKKISSGFVVAGLMYSFYIYADFLLLNFYGFDLRSVLPHPEYISEAQWTAYGGGIHLARGLAEEPGHSALFFELMIPLSYYRISHKAVAFKGSFFIFVIPAYLMLMSSASMSGFLSSIVVGTLAFGSKGVWRYGRFMVALGFLSLVVTTTPAREYLSNTIEAKATELYLGEGLSGGARRERFEQLAKLFEVAPFGLGWGSVSGLHNSIGSYKGVEVPDGFLSLYGDALGATGVFGLAFFLIFFTNKLWRLFSLGNGSSKYIFIALLSLSLHYIFIGNFWYPYIWIAAALAELHIRQSKCSSKKITVKERSDAGVGGPELAARRVE